MPDEPSTNCVIRIEDYNDSSLFSVSGNFEITSSPDTTSPGITLGALVLDGTIDDPSIAAVQVGGIAVSVTASVFSGLVSVPADGTSIDVVATDAAGNSSVRTLQISIMP